MKCEVCNGSKGNVEKIRGVYMHTGCAPAHWIKDRDDSKTFMAKVRAGGWWTRPGREKR